MSDALGTFLNNLVACSGMPRERVSILIISDNARKMLGSDFDHKAQVEKQGLRRCSSTPLNHMASRWETSSCFDSNTYGTSPMRIHPTLLKREQASRWDSESAPGYAPKMTRPRRENDADRSLLSPVHNTGRLRNKHSKIQTKKLKKADLPTANVPKSLLLLPY